MTYNEEKIRVQGLLLESYNEIFDSYLGILEYDKIEYLREKLNENRDDLNHYIDEFASLNPNIPTEIAEAIKGIMIKQRDQILADSQLDELR